MSPNRHGFIDVHHHMIPDLYNETLRKYGFDEVGGRETPEWSSELSLGLMERNGIDFSITSISAPGVHFGDSAEALTVARNANEFSANLIATYPSKFGSFGVLPMPDVEASIAVAHEVLDDLKLDGVVLMSSHFDGSYLGDPKFDAVMEVLNEYSARVFVHPAIPTVAASIPVQIPIFAMEFTFDTTRAAFNMVFNGVMERYPQISWILSHAGGTVPYLVDRFELLWFTDEALMARAPQGARGYLSKLYYDTALSANHSALASVRELVGPDQILFGSDYPFAPELATMVSVGSINERLALPEDVRTAITYESALKLFPSIASRLAR